MGSVTLAESVEERFAEEHEVTLGSVDSELVSGVCQAGHLDPGVFVVHDAIISDIGLDGVRVSNEVGASIVCVVCERQEGGGVTDCPFDIGCRATGVNTWNLVALVMLKLEFSLSVFESAFSFLSGASAIGVSHSCECAGSLSHSGGWMFFKLNYNLTQTFGI